MKQNQIPKFAVRFTIIYIASLFIYSLYQSVFNNVDTFNDWYVLMLESCLYIVVSSQGKFHCKFIKWTCLSILISGTITRLDNAYDFIPLGYWCLLPALILVL